MKFFIYAIVVMFFLSACSHREYFKVSSGGSGNLDKDLASCEYESELNTKSSNIQNIIVNFDRKETKKERKEREQSEQTNRAIAESTRNGKVSRMTDLCMRAKGWSWKMVKNK